MGCQYTTKNGKIWYNTSFCCAIWQTYWNRHFVKKKKKKSTYHSPIFLSNYLRVLKDFWKWNQNRNSTEVMWEKVKYKNRFFYHGFQISPLCLAMKLKYLRWIVVPLISNVYCDHFLHLKSSAKCQCLKLVNIQDVLFIISSFLSCWQIMTSNNLNIVLFPTYKIVHSKSLI